MIHQNLLRGLGEYSSSDYRFFKDHLRLPLRYMRVIFKNYPNRLGDAVLQMHWIISMSNKHDWETLMSEKEVSLLEKRYRIANIPPLFFNHKPIITSRSTDQADFERVSARIDKAQGEVFYFHSEFSEGAMNAAFSIAKSAIDKRMRCYCTSFPEIIAEMKEGWTTHSAYQLRVRNDDLVVIYAVGSEYTTEFTNNLLQDILRTRTINARVTILCSALSPKQYFERYKSQPEGIEVGFTDERIKKTLKLLAKEVCA